MVAHASRSAEASVVPGGPGARIRSMPRLDPSLLALCLLLPACVGTEPATQEKSVRPGINKGFLDPKMDAAKMAKRFEVESREIYAHRHRIARAMDLC